MTGEIKKTRSNKYKEIKEESSISKEDIDTEQEEKKPLLPKILFIIILFLVLFFIYISLIATSIVDIKEYKIESDKISSSFHGLKIIHLSDIHYGTTINQKQLNNIVEKINNLKPDVIFFTGDLIDKNIVPNDKIKKEIISSLSKLKCSLYKYAIYGNEDYDNEFYKEIITSSDFILLNNETKLLYYKNDIPIQITGFNSVDNNPDYSIINQTTEETSNYQLYKIILTHEPDSIDNIIKYNPDLVLSGHSLGGLIKIPFIKPLFLEKGATKYYDDYYKINNTELYISNGLGTSGINARFNNHPSFNLYRLYKKDSNK